jgi:CheY-like chemotaxis protein
MTNSRPRILIVEDDKPTAHKYQRALEEIGESRTAERVDQVFKEIIDFEPNLILLDIRLEGEKVYHPEEAGIRILEQIKSLRPPFKEIPVIVITAFIDPEIEERCRSLGAVDFYRKPVPLNTLRHAVTNALQNQLSQAGQKIKVFISSTMAELSAERATIKQAILDLGSEYHPELAEDWAARPEPPSQLWQRGVRECDVFILVIGVKYGMPLSDIDISPTEDEYNQALKAEKPILVFEKRAAKAKRDPRLEAFAARLYDLRTGHVVCGFSTLTQLRNEVQKSLKKLNKGD